MKLPNVGISHQNERLGVAALQMYAAKNGLIWRETNSSDVGIDGHPYGAEGRQAFRMHAQHLFVPAFVNRCAGVLQIGDADRLH